MAYAGVTSEQKVRLITKDPSILSSGDVDSSIMNVLVPHNGVIFPYTPTIQISHDANYGSYDLVHSNYQPQYYVNSVNPTISVQANFTAQTVHEAKYTAAAMQLFKSATKMNFGTKHRNGSNLRPGMPPPVFLFSAYGTLHSKNTPVVIKGFNYALPEDVDYITFSHAGKEMSLPAQVIISLTLTVQYNPDATKNFDIQKYRRGDSLSGDIGFF